MVFSPLLIAALLPLAAQAANDWNKPCFGSCSWDITTGKGSGTVQLVRANRLRCRTDSRAAHRMKR